MTKYEPEWFLDDANYEAVVTMPLRIMRQLAPMLPPPMLRVNGLQVADALHAGLDPLSCCKPSIQIGTGGVPEAKALECVDVGLDASISEQLKKYADGSIVYLSGVGSVSRAVRHQLSALPGSWTCACARSSQDSRNKRASCPT